MNHIIVGTITTGWQFEPYCASIYGEPQPGDVVVIDGQYYRWTTARLAQDVTPAVKRYQQELDDWALQLDLDDAHANVDPRWQ